MKTYRLLLIIGSVIGLTACGQSDIPVSGSGSANSSPTPLVRTLEGVTAAAHGRDVTTTPYVPEATLNLTPVIEGNTIVINSDARLYGVDHPYPPVAVRVGQKIRITPFASGAFAYETDYDSGLLTIDPQIDAAHPDSNGWVWTAVEPGATSIIIGDVPQPCSDCGGIPPRQVQIDLIVEP